MWVKFFHLEKKVAERPYCALLQQNTYPSDIYPTYQVRVQSAVETQTRSRGTIPKITLPYQTKQYRSVKTKL